MRRQMGKKRFRFAERLDFKPGRLEQPGYGLTDRCIVINKTNNRCTIGHALTLGSHLRLTQSDLSPGFDRRSNPSFLQYYHQLGYRRYIELLHHMRPMSLDRFFGHPKLTAYLFVEQSRSYELHYFVFTRR